MFLYLRRLRMQFNNFHIWIYFMMSYLLENNKKMNCGFMQTNFSHYYACGLLCVEIEWMVMILVNCRLEQFKLKNTHIYTHISYWIFDQIWLFQFHKQPNFIYYYLLFLYFVFYALCICYIFVYYLINSISIMLRNIITVKSVL